jgi:hypothetical protein
VIQIDNDNIKALCTKELSVLNVCCRIMTEVQDSIRKHGDWSDYPTEKMFEAIDGERIELGLARDGMDVTGQHGMVREAIQSAACLVKLIIQLEARNGQS